MIKMVEQKDEIFTYKNKLTAYMDPHTDLLDLISKSTPLTGNKITLDKQWHKYHAHIIEIHLTNMQSKLDVLMLS